jgi:drug/metabolite transporter (DMT)-like permease
MVPVLGRFARSGAEGVPRSKMRPMTRREGELAAAAAAVLFGTAWVATAIALRSFTPATAAFWRGALAGVLLLAIVGSLVARGRIAVHPTRRGVGRLVLLSMLGGPAFGLAMNLAIANAGATIAAFVAGAYPVLAATIAPFVLREPLSRGAAVGFVLALAGAILLTELDLARAPLAGIAVGLLGALSFAIYLVLLRRWAGSARGDRDPLLIPEVTATAVVVSTAVVLLVVVLLTESATLVPAAPVPEALVAILWLAIGPGCLSQLFIAVSARRITARRSAAFLLLNPVTAALTAPLILGELLSPVQAAGAGLVLAGIALAATR